MAITGGGSDDGADDRGFDGEVLGFVAFAGKAPPGGAEFGWVMVVMVVDEGEPLYPSVIEVVTVVEWEEVRLADCTVDGGRAW